MARYKVIISIVEEGSDDLGLVSHSAWVGAVRICAEGVRLMHALCKTVLHHDRVNEEVKRG